MIEDHFMTEGQFMIKDHFISNELRFAHELTHGVVNCASHMNCADGAWIDYILSKKGPSGLTPYGANDMINK